MPYTLKTNNKPRPLASFNDLPQAERGRFEYVDEEDRDSPRMFLYRGSWYDAEDFECAPHDVAALGFDGVQADSMFSAVVLRYFDCEGYAYDDAVVVGYLYW